jgi:lipid-binding SYLF domain-containing protein
LPARAALAVNRLPVETPMKRLLLVLLSIAAIGAATRVLRADDARLKSAASALSDMTGNNEYGISPTLLAKGRCIAVIPGVKKAALGVGGQYGRGYISCRTGGGWSAPGAIRIEGGSIGLQIGGAATDVVLLVLNQQGADRLLSSKFTVGADASVAAGPVGRQASAATDVTLTAEILAWSKSRGAFAGISLQGSTLREDSTENKDLYGKEIANKDIVGGSVAVPSGAAPLMAVLSKL